MTGDAALASGSAITALAKAFGVEVDEATPLIGSKLSCAVLTDQLII